MYHFLVPPGRAPDAPDVLFAEQCAALLGAGFSASICPDRVLGGGGELAGVPAGSTVIYRGWMATAAEYESLAQAIRRAGATPLTSPTEYLAAHHLPNWYPLAAEFTPETRVFPEGADLAAEAAALGWGAYFVKDYVKSLKTGRGSVARSPEEVPLVVAELREERGRVEGGVCLRRVEEFDPGTEVRYFVLNGVPHAPGAGPVPGAVRAVAARVRSPFFSIDAARRRDGVLRVVELGDGQVSDLVGWGALAFAAIWTGGAGA